MIPELTETSPRDLMLSHTEQAYARVAGREQDVLLAALHIFDREADFLCPQHELSAEEYATTGACLWALARLIERRATQGH